MISDSQPSEMLEPELWPADTQDRHQIHKTTERVVCRHFGYPRTPCLRHSAEQPNGRKVMVAATQWREKNGTHNGKQHYTNGRYDIKWDDYDYLTANNGAFAFLVYETHPDGIIPLYIREAPARMMRDYVLDPEDYARSHFESPDDVLHIPWTTIFPNTGANL